MNKLYNEYTKYANKQSDDAMSDNKQNLITELKNKYDKQQSLIYSIKVILGKNETETNDIKNLIEKHN